MRRLGCAAVLLLLAVIAGEIWLYLVVAHAIHDYLAPIVAMIVASVIGVRLIMSAMSTMPQALLGGTTGRLVVRVFAGVLLAFPGLGTSLLGLILLVPGFDRLFARLGDKVVAAVMRQSMQRMMSGKGFPFGGGGGFPFGPGGGFPFPPGGPGAGGPAGGPFAGIAPRVPTQPDDRLPRSGPKTYDTRAEKDP